MNLERHLPVSESEKLVMKLLSDLSVIAVDAADGLLYFLICACNMCTMKGKSMCLYLLPASIVTPTFRTRVVAICAVRNSNMLKINSIYL